MYVPGDISASAHWKYFKTSDIIHLWTIIFNKIVDAYPIIIRDLIVFMYNVSKQNW